MDHALCADVTEEKDYWKDLDPVLFFQEKDSVVVVFLLD